LNCFDNFCFYLTRQGLHIQTIHQLKQKLNALDSLSWGQRETGELLGIDSKSFVSNCLTIAKLLRAELGPDNKPLPTARFWLCDSVADAWRLLLRDEENKINAELARLSQAAAIPIEQFQEEQALLSEFEAIEEAPDALAGESEKYYSNPLNPPGSFEEYWSEKQAWANQVRNTIHISNKFVKGDSIAYMNDPANAGRFDHVITDIPYGIDMSNLDEKQVADVKDTHDVDQNISMMPVFLRAAFAAVKPGGFCVFFYDLDHHEKLQTWAKEIGWKVQRWPYIAAKSSACQNNAAQYNTTKNYEVAMFLRRDEKTVLRKQGQPSVKTYDFAAERKLYNNPFAKPFELWKDIYDLIAFPGQSVLDPFCGEMSAGRAAAMCGLLPHGVEISEQHYNRGLENMRKAYAVIHKSNCVFT